MHALCRNMQALCRNMQALCRNMQALWSFANITSSLSTVTLRGFRTLFDGEGCMMTEVSLGQVKPMPVGQSKWYEAWWKKNPRPSGQKWILIHFRGFLFHHASCHLLWPAGLGFTCHKCTANNVKPSPSNKVQKPLRVAMERELILANDHSACMLRHSASMLWPQCLHVATQCKHVATQFLFFISMHLHCAFTSHLVPKRVITCRPLQMYKCPEGPQKKYHFLEASHRHNIYKQCCKVNYLLHG